MKTFFLAVICIFFWVAGATAADLYLSDGSIIKARNITRSGDKVVVLINRESIAEFNLSEVDMKRTFSGRKTRVAKSYASRPVTKSETAEPTAATKAPLPMQQKPEAPKPPSTVTPTKEAVVTPKAATPAAPPVTKFPAEVTPPVSSIPNDTTQAVPLNLSPKVTLIPLAIGLFFALIMIAAVWRIFEKAGQAGWKCLIPVYNAYIFIIISGKPGWWIILLMIPIINVITNLLLSLSLAERFGKSALYGVGLFLLGPIMFLHLAFSDASYQG